MNIRLELDSVNEIVRVSVQGEVTDDSLWLSYEALTNLCNRYCPRALIVDYTTAKVKLSSQSVLDLASKRPIFPDCLIIKVAPQNQMKGTYGLLRMFQKVAENRPNFRVVGTMEEALDLLEVKSPKFDAVLDTSSVPLGT